MTEDPITELELQVSAEPGAAPEQVDDLTRQLLTELRDLEVESAELATAGPAPEGAKSGEAVTVGAIALTVLPTFLPKVVDFVQAWVTRGEGRVVKFKGKVGGQQIEFEGSAEALKTMLATLSSDPPKSRTRKKKEA
jgi:hypothetical protein